MDNANKLVEVLTKNNNNFYNVVKFDSNKDKLLLMDFTEQNNNLTTNLLSDVTVFTAFIQQQLASNNYKYGIGGYDEDRVVYSVHNHFTANSNENRSIHLGIDIWAEEGTIVYAPLGGMVHSFAYNNAIGDYGATIILQHQLDTISFYTLYGHLSLKSIEKLSEGQYISRGNIIGYLGNTTENGNWPPHLHFQIIEDIELKEGDYPGVCSKKDREKYLANCPNPNLILKMMEFVNKA